MTALGRGRRASALGRGRRASVGAISLGCPKNLVDTEVMLGLLQEAGFAVVSDLSQADVLLVNTCCFIGPAREESAEALAEAASWRRSDEARVLICAGCWPQDDPAALHEQFPEIDALMGPGDVPQIANVVEKAIDGAGSRRPAASPSAYLYSDSDPRVRTTPPWSAYVKVAEGCNHRCRFCVIPRLRGRYRSRPLESIVAEVGRLAADGVKEINLVAQDTTAYGRDLKGPDVADLLSAVARVEQAHWVRLLYAYPNRVTERVIEVMAREPRICEYLDLPFQHADGEMLRSMGRPGDGDEYLNLIERVRKAMPEVAIRSTFLVGFPGENEPHFRRLLEFLEAAQLDRAGAFCYSPERGTPAAEMPDQVSPQLARERYHELMSLQQGISRDRNQRWVGREMEVLVEGRAEPGGDWVGRSFRDAPEIDGTVRLTAGRAPLPPGAFIRVEVTAAEPYDLVAKPLGGKARRGRAARPRINRPSQKRSGRGRRP